MTEPSDKIEHFLWEPRYFVLKRCDMINLTSAQWQQLKEITKVHDAHRERLGKPEFDAIVVESDWPEHDPTWAAIEARTVKENKQ